MSRNSHLIRLILDFRLSAIALSSVLLVGCVGQPSAPQQDATPVADAGIASLRKRADAGNADAQFTLGVLYDLGPLGLLQDYELAASWYRKAADQGHVQAQYDLGVRYLTGRGLQQDDAQALVWFRKAADQGHAQAQYDLGVRYLAGQGVPRDDAQSLAWFRKAAAQGQAQAQYNLGVRWCRAFSCRCAVGLRAPGRSWRSG